MDTESTLLECWQYEWLQAALGALAMTSRP
jgi:hypothetical protein